MAKAVAEGKAPKAIGLKRLTNADAAGETHLLQISAHGLKRSKGIVKVFYISQLQGRQGCHKAWRLHAAIVSPKADTIVTGLNGEGS